MVRHPTNGQEYAAFVPDNSGNVFFEFITEGRLDERFSVLCAEDDMVEQVGQGAGHGGLLTGRPVRWDRQISWHSQFSGGLHPRLYDFAPYGADDGQSAGRFPLSGSRGFAPPAL